MTIRWLLVVLALGCSGCINGFAEEMPSHAFVKIYLVSWDSQLLNKESIESIRQAADVYTEVREKYYARSLLSSLHLDQLEKSGIPAAEDFKIQLVIDVTDEKHTFISDGKQLCDESLKHCIAVDQQFKQRFDPSY